LIEGSYSLRVRWSGYDSYFPDISISNESVYLEIRIETVRVDIRSLQKIPGVTVYVDAWGGDEFYAYEILIADEPSFYVPSMSHIWFGIEGGPESFRSPHHFSYYLQNYDNGNVTLSVNENWILIGNVAMTPGRFVMMIALVSIFVLTILIFRRKILESSIYAPFLLLVLGNALPTYTTSRTSYRFPLALPIYSNYLETQTVSIGIGSSISSLDGGVLAVSSAGYDVMTQIGYISIALLLVAFGTILYEYLRKDTDLETSDFPMLVSVLATLIFQIVFTANFFISNISWRNVTLGPALIFTSLANIVWIILYKRQGKPIFETN
jgi:hypothetical protein